MVGKLNRVIMRNKLKQYLLILCSLITFAHFYACEDTLLNNMVDDRVYLLKSGLNETQVYNFDQATAKVIVVKSGVGQTERKVRLDVSPNVLSAYNTANLTDYKALPTSVYTLQAGELNIPTDSREAVFEFIIDVVKYRAALANEPGVTFVIPCEVTNLNPGERDSAKMQTLVLPTIIEPYIYFSNPGFRTENNDITSKSQDILHFINKIEINYPANGAVQYTLGIPANSSSLIAEYNATHSSNYVMLPTDAVSLQTTGEIIQGVNYGNYTFQILKSKLANKYGKYLLPLKIEQVSQSKIHPTDNIVLIPFNYYE
ncbi:DUF1735 domain-containing protein [Sphingobacterium sp. DK4209]|uniref:DUF1735 domain-containing protein n=2 Tax=Sphingobacterium zhuxiongii TaxID=2662364 RepID=A0A5Q0QGB9_9SPHI|nr:DUF1735 domain-containing protein [Sphingobacterium sp. DK4209]QGA26948.1 DUF1735 domain-containing protein [Sphingobacterium sp. dk4302]